MTVTQDADLRATFIGLQDRLLAYYRVEATSRLVSLRQPALTAHLLEAGAGEPAVVLHGGDGEAVDWAPLLRRLQDHLHVYAVDRPGFGLSDPFDYHQSTCAGTPASSLSRSSTPSTCRPPP